MTRRRFAVGGDIDYEALSNASDGSQIPVGAVVKGDPSRIEQVLDKLRSHAAAARRAAGVGQLR